jgi:small conductance mechanosensitive channel
MEKYIEMLKELALTYGLSLLYALIIFLVGKAIAKTLTSFTKKLMAKSSLDATLSNFLSGIVYYVLLIIVIIAALNQLGIETTSIVAVFATAGLAVGLALKDSLSNFAAGVMIILFRPFVIGNFVEAGGTSGVVEGINIFTTQMRTGDNKTIIVPNSGILNGNIVNYSTKETRRVDLTIGIGYDDDIKKAKELLHKILSEDSRILADPEPMVAVAELADSSVNFTVRSWVNSADYWGVYFDTLEAVKLRFDEAGIGIPYPQMDVHLHKEN